jgi:hypothetical protein
VSARGSSTPPRRDRPARRTTPPVGRRRVRLTPRRLTPAVLSDTTLSGTSEPRAGPGNGDRSAEAGVEPMRRSSGSTGLGRTVSDRAHRCLTPLSDSGVCPTRRTGVSDAELRPIGLRRRSGSNVVDGTR